MDMSIAEIVWQFREEEPDARAATTAARELDPHHPDDTRITVQFQYRRRVVMYDWQGGTLHAYCDDGTTFVYRDYGRWEPDVVVVIPQPEEN